MNKTPGTAADAVRFSALGLLLLSGCAYQSTVSLSDERVPMEAEWGDLPEHVRAEFLTMAALADSTQRLDRPPYPVGGMAGLVAGMRYPPRAHRADIQGQVVVQATVGADGSVTSASVWRSAHPLLDAEALAVVQRGRFEPAERGGEAVAADVCIPITFRTR